MHEGLRRCPAAGRAAILAACALLSIAEAPSSEARDGAAGATGTPAAAWNMFREGAKRAREGDLKGALESYAEARSSLGESVPLDRSLVDALALDLYNLAASLSSASDADSALRCFEQIFLLRKRAGSLKDAAFEQTLKSGSDTLADYAVSTGRAASAIPVYRARIEIEPSNPGFRLKLASALFALGKLDEARKEALEVRRLDPRSPESWVMTARTDMAESRPLMVSGAQREARLKVEWATDDLAEALKLDRANAARLREYASDSSTLADLLDEEGDYTGGDAARGKSLGAIDEALTSASAVGDLRLDRGRILMKADRPSEAAKDFEKAIGALDREGPPESLRAAKEALAACLLVVASDAVNEGRFAEAAGTLSRIGSLDPGRRFEIDGLAASTERLRHLFEERAAAGETRPVGHQESGGRLLDLSDLYFTYGRYDEARAALSRASSADDGRPGEPQLTLRSYRMRPGIPAPAKKAEIDVEGGRIALICPSEEVIASLRKPLPDAWRRAKRILGPFPSGETPTVKVYDNQRAFRSSGTPRLGSTMTGKWHRGSITLFVEPGRDAAAWGKVLARVMGAWASERLSRNRAPLWLRDGISHWLADDARPDEGDSLRRALAAGRWVPIDRLDAALAESWNDEFGMEPLEAETRLLVSTLVAARGEGALRATLLALAAGSGLGPDRALAASSRLDTTSLEKMAQGSLAPVAIPPKP